MPTAEKPFMWSWPRILPPAAAIALGASQALAGDLPAGHAHNDFLHSRPLFDALSHRFSSVEVDIHLRDGRLFVAHDARDIVPDRTLQSLYLDPLVTRIRENGGSVYGDGRPLTLLIDIKTDAEDTYQVLDEILQRFRNILTVFGAREIREGAVVAIVSGKRARRLMEAQEVRYAALDGRLTDLGSGAPAALIPLISDRWTTHFTWRGDGTMPPAERAKLDRIVAEAHAAGQRVRFWATPDEPGQRRTAIWRVLREAGVDFINTDDLAGLAAFLDPTP